MNYTILTFGNKLLRKESKRVANVDDDIRALCNDMIRIMYENSGIGLAAPQIGILKRIVVIDDNSTGRAFINPEIRDASAEMCVMNEGCLSVPDKFLNIRRAESILLRYKDLNGKLCYDRFHGLVARILQHEIDHLDGMFFTDYQ